MPLQLHMKIYFKFNYIQNHSYVSMFSLTLHFVQKACFFHDFVLFSRLLCFVPQLGFSQAVVISGDWLSVWFCCCWLNAAAGARWPDTRVHVCIVVSMCPQQVDERLFYTHVKPLTDLHTSLEINVVRTLQRIKFWNEY